MSTARTGVIIPVDQDGYVADPNATLIYDGYGILFDPAKHAYYITRAMWNAQREENAKLYNPPPIVEVPEKPYPAGHYFNKGSGV